MTQEIATILLFSIIHNPTTLPSHVSYFISIISINFITYNLQQTFENERYSQSNVKKELADEN